MLKTDFDDAHNFTFPFYQCDWPNYTISDGNILPSDYVSADSLCLFRWYWIPPVLLVIYTFLRELDQLNLITFMSKYFGSSVYLIDILKGPLILKQNEVEHSLQNQSKIVYITYLPTWSW